MTAAALEGLALLMTLDEAIAACAARGWEHNLGPGDGRFTVAPSAPVLIVSVKIERGRIVLLEASYEPPAAARAEAALAQLPIARAGDILGRAWRAAWSGDRAQLIVAFADGRNATAAHVGAIASEREVRAYLATFGDDLAPPVRT